MPVQRLKRSIIQPKVMSGGENAGGADLEGHGAIVARRNWNASFFVPLEARTC
jgi:hypothetical protein